MRDDSLIARTAGSPVRDALWPLAVVFAISGAGMLAVETTWLRWLRDWMGATAPATAATTTAIFAGSSLGAWLGGRWARRVASRGGALRAYAAAEVLAAVGAVAAPVLMEAASRGLSAVYPWVAHDGAVLAALRFAAALGATLPAAAAWGATFPLLGTAALPSPAAMGDRGVALYATGALGSVLGVALASWWAPPRIGVPGTYAVGIGLSLVAALGARALASHDTAARTTQPPAPEALGPLPHAAVALSALSGFVSLGAQVLFVNAFALVVDQSAIAFGAVLAAVLLCLALGAFAVAGLHRTGVASGRGVAGWALVASAWAFGLAPAWIHRTTGGLQSVGIEPSGVPYALAVLGMVLLCAGPALVAAACVWPAALALAGDAGARSAATGTDDGAAGRGEAGFRLGALSAANTLGAIAGGVVAPFVLLPALGPWGAFLAIAAACGLGGAALAPDRGRRRWPRAVAVALGGAVVLLAADPLALPMTRLPPGARVLSQRSGASGVVSVLERDGERVLRIDNHYALGGTAERTHEERQGHLPLVLHGRPRRVAFVGAATGITAGAALAHGVEEITLVEIVPDVARAGATYFADANRGVYRDPKSRVVVDDARNYFRHGDDLFDVIVADLFVPWRAGTGALYSREHFEAMRDRLRPGGLVAQWLPLYQLSEDELEIVLATFGDVFPTAALFRGDFYGSYPIAAVVGWKDAPAPARAVEEAAARLRAAGVGDRWVTDPDALWSLYVAPLAPAGGDVPRNRLSFPRVEFLAAARHAGGSRGALGPIVGLDWVRRTEAWQAAAPDPDPLYPDLSPGARRARRGGDALQRAGALWAEKRSEDAAREVARAASLLPARVLADAPADPTAADVWLDAPPAPP